MEHMDIRGYNGLKCGFFFRNSFATITIQITDTGDLYRLRVIIVCAINWIQKTRKCGTCPFSGIVFTVGGGGLYGRWIFCLPHPSYEVFTISPPEDIYVLYSWMKLRPRTFFFFFLAGLDVVLRDAGSVYRQIVFGLRLITSVQWYIATYTLATQSIIIE